MPSEQDKKVWLPDEVARTGVDSLFDTLPRDGDKILIVGYTESLLDVALEQLNDEQQDAVSILAIESDSSKISSLREQYRDLQILGVEFETANLGEFDYLLLFPPIGPANQQLDDEVRERVANRFGLKGRIDLYQVYLANGLTHLGKKGRLVAILPSSFLNARTASPLRRRLVEEFYVEAIQTRESVFESSDDGIVILTITHNHTRNTTVTLKEEGDAIIDTHGIEASTDTPSGDRILPRDGDNWARAVQGVEPPAESDYILDDIVHRIGVGVSTGADDVFILEPSEVLPQFDQQWLYPVIGGRELAANEAVQSDKLIITPYRSGETEATLEELGDIADWLELYQEKLEERQSRRSQPWYGWIRHPPIEDLTKPKLLVRDFADEFKFYPDREGEYIPRRSVYYIIPSEDIVLESLLEYLNQASVNQWLKNSSVGGRGVNRLYVQELRNIPVPAEGLTDHD